MGTKRELQKQKKRLSTTSIVSKQSSISDVSVAFKERQFSLSDTEPISGEGCEGKFKTLFRDRMLQDENVSFLATSCYVPPSVKI